MQELIQIGDEIENSDGDAITVDSVEQGRYGLRVGGRFTKTGHYFYTFVPYELQPVDIDIHDWQGIWRRGYIKLQSGLRLGDVCFIYKIPHTTIEEYEAEWERTIEQIRIEGTEVNEKGS